MLWAVRYDREFLFWDISFISPFFYSIAVVCAGVSSRTTNKSKFYFLCVIARLFFKYKEIFWIAWALEDIFRYSLRHLFWINEITSFCQRNLLCDEQKNRQGCLTLVLRWLVRWYISPEYHFFGVLSRGIKKAFNFYCSQFRKRE